MKTINNYIQEKLVINTKIKNQTYSSLVHEVLGFLWAEPEEASKEELKTISDWVESNKINDITVSTTENVLKSYEIIDKENGISLEDIKDGFENDHFRIQIIDESLYNKYSKNLGTQIWKDKYDYTKIFINNEQSYLVYQSYMGGNIFFIGINKK